MSSMLDQAIIDAQALREAALKNAEQSVIEKYAPEIKAAVEELLEAKTVIQEAPEAAADGGYNIPFASDPKALSDDEVEMGIEFEFNPEDFVLDLGDIKDQAEADPSSSGEQPETTEQLAAEVAPEATPPAEDAGGVEGLEALLQESEEDKMISELLEMLGEEEAEDEFLEEALTVDVDEEKHGHFVTDDGTRKYDTELRLAKQQSTEYKERAEELEGELEKLKGSIVNYKNMQDRLHGAISDMKGKLEETLVQNARLLYSNKVLRDASLNERQKSKIVEAIAQAETIKEAKSLYSTLKEATVGASQAAPKSLSESVNRKSTLSHVLPRRKQETLNENLSFSDRMKKLAGIDN